MSTLTSENRITRTLIQPDDVGSTLSQYLGGKPAHAILFEMNTFRQLDSYADAYHGGQWQFFALSNRGVYMAPIGEGQLTLEVPSNHFTGSMSFDAAGIVASLFTLNMLAWKTNNDDVGESFYRLRDFACAHAEASSILRAID
ncbi:antirestriction protein [Pokkaliibacter sp. MBI-7]|uniref:antirestriction protein n=1 Tax=Pokkaliibacter sp. MBI-7 TaxID=3040600 RepID=UPI0024469A79|nr:antirestriction protein [Pokkaliibacter sp. MBI-7]MDH2430966.1 antirestriction protein [Pokkaliibacter sp. MBI-7]MDH2434702.1 antirestriction protein [Pokkaliibacter sp. MBI-7]